MPNKLHLAHLYPFSMNTYGDSGNVICLKQRALWRDIEVVIHQVEIGDPLPDEIDLYFIGGGQDAAQISVAKDLQAKATRIKQDVTQGIPLLAICGGYQLLGNSYQPAVGEKILGIGIFPVETVASSTRMIGNVVLENPSFSKTHNTLVGFENHSGKTTFTGPAKPLGKVLVGHGNNGEDKTEGCILQNAIGCYLHGSVLPKNPHLADWLLDKALTRHDPAFTITPLEDKLEWQAHDYIVGRYK